MGKTHKVMTTMAQQQDAELQGRFKRLVTSQLHPDCIIWIDEVWPAHVHCVHEIHLCIRLPRSSRVQMHKGWKEMGRRRRGRSDKGRIAKNYFPHGLARRWSVLGAMTSTGMLQNTDPSCTDDLFDAIERGLPDGPRAMNTTLFWGAFARLVPPPPPLHENHCVDAGEPSHYLFFYAVRAMLQYSQSTAF